MKDYLRKNKVLVNGQRVMSLKANVAESDEIFVNDERISESKPKLLTILLHKPKGYISTTALPSERISTNASTRLGATSNRLENSVLNLLPEDMRKRRPKFVICGRLDKWVSGLMVLTQDRSVYERLLHHEEGKTYSVVLKEPLSGKEIELLESGLLVLRNEKKPCKPAKVTVVDVAKRHYHITLFEGRYHQVRRMFAALNNWAQVIQRFRVGPFSLDDFSSLKSTPSSFEIVDYENYLLNS